MFCNLEQTELSSVLVRILLKLLLAGGFALAIELFAEKAVYQKSIVFTSTLLRGSKYKMGTLKQIPAS
jgi:hypothetical protein